MEREMKFRLLPEKFDLVPLWLSAKIKEIYLKIHKKQRIILMNTPDHFNLGDHAITIGIYIFFKKYFPNIKIIEFTGYQCSMRGINLHKYISKHDILAFNGGGYLGSLWPKEDALFWKLVSEFKENIKVMFPQTLYYEDIDDQLVKKYANCKNLYMFLRDTESLNIFQQIVKEVRISKEYNHCSNHVQYNSAPDMVNLIYTKYQHKSNCNEIGICLRGDCESLLTDNFKENLSMVLKKDGLIIKPLETVIKKGFPSFFRISKLRRNKLLKKKLNEVANTRLIITDRLHCMLFAAITGTPCIALDNVSTKVKGAYNWVSHLEYIKFIDNQNLSKQVLDAMLTQKTYIYNNEPLISEFDKIAQIFYELNSGQNKKKKTILYN
jgi:pyruvyl transferase EpsI